VCRGDLTHHIAGHHPTVIRDRRDRAPWYTTKRHPSYLDMIVKLRQVLIATQYQPEVVGRPTSEEIRAVRLALGAGSGVVAKAESGRAG
jgi:hypothetical protein